MMPTKSNKTAAKSGFSAKPQPQPEPAANPAANPAPKDDDAMITTLQAKLADAASQSAALHQTIDDLEAKLAAQTKTLDGLQTQAKAAASLQTTLEKAEAAARQLAALNNKLLEENSALKSAATAAPEPKKSTALAATPDRPFNSMVHPVFPNGTLPSGIGDQEIGWFD
jgi:uncharacterized coiled-coil protein SlyX